MRILGKTLAYWVENFLGIISAIIFFFILIIKKKCQFDLSLDMIKAFPTIGITSFGFLLTVLSIIVQGNGVAIEFLRNRTTLYNRFIGFNKRAILLSFILTILTFIVGNLKVENYFTDTIIIYRYKHFIVACFYGMLVWFLIDLISFLRIFYLLIKK